MTPGPSHFAEFFRHATGYEPYAYQCRLACGPDAKADDLDTLKPRTACASQLISVPTGLGKTAAVVLAWLWNRVHLQSEKWPRRLVYCLPMRTLVEQTKEEVENWIRGLLDTADNLRLQQQTRKDLDWLMEHSPIILMGGEGAGEWDIHPERPAILIGTQDMLLSKALNRGYGMSRYRWPMHFALLNNDCLWVMDEPQLMGVGMETSAQLDGFRQAGEHPTVRGCPTWWMSATLRDTRLATVDHPAPTGGWPRLELSTEEKEKPGSRPMALFEARKAISRCELALSATTKADYAKMLASLIAARHRAGTLTLVVVNRVGRAQEIYEALTISHKKSRQPLYDRARVALIHSRFRQNDRKQHEQLLFGDGNDDRIVIATQAVEAGVDVSARLLITELAPWSSLVQRIGRCNRRAETPDAEVLWVEIEPDAKGDFLLPYAKPELDQAKAALATLTDASPRSLSGINVAEATVIRPVIRRRDLVDLFDTTPDICGQDLDISRYIRDGEDSDVQFFWRALEGDTPGENEPPPQREELCRVSIGDANKFLRKKPRAWRWNPLHEQWDPASQARPGSIVLVATDAGGYDGALGWTGEPKNKPKPYPTKEGTLDRYPGDRLSLAREWQTIAAHSFQVEQATAEIAASLGLSREDSATLGAAALWHDIGKAHADFQKMLRDGPHQPEDATAFYAKSKNAPRPSNASKDYRSLRHELASALAWLLQGPTDAADRDLVAYLIAAHHGKVRLSIRSLPEEKGDPQDAERPFARGIWHGDKLPPIQFARLTVSETTLDLSFMRMGEGPHGPSWLARGIALRDRLGPFRLAFLETLLRAADARASAYMEAGAK